MDEPLSALDSQTRELLMEDFIRLLADGAMGAVYVTHNLEEAVRLADRIVVLSRRPGRVREVVTIPMTRSRARRHQCPRQIAGAAERAVVADPRRGDRRRARGPACLTARRRRCTRRTMLADSAAGRVFAAPASRRARAAISGWIALALVIALWQLAGSAGWVNPLFLPAPSAIALAIYKLAMSGALWQHLSWSIMRIGVGWILGTVAGVDRRLRDRPLDAGARRRHHLHLGAVSDSEDRAVAAVDPVARDRRGAEDRDHCARRVLLHRDLGL